MSTDEQDQVLGRMMREQTETQRQIALLDEQFAKLSNDLGTVDRMIPGRPDKVRLSSTALPETFNQYFDGSKFLEVLKEYNALTARSLELSRNISRATGASA